MPKISGAVVHHRVFQGSTEFIGVAEVTLPAVTLQQIQVSGSGIGGSFNMALPGFFDPMTATFNFTHVDKKSIIKLLTPEIQEIEVSAVVNTEDREQGKIGYSNNKYVMKIQNSGYTAGSINAPNPSNASGTYSVHYFAEYIDGVKMLEVDPINFIYKVGVTDYSADFRKVLGM